MVEERSTVTIQEQAEVGQVKIADEVVAIIAGMATSEVEGIHSVGTGVTGRKNKKNFSKGVEIDIAGHEVICNVDVIIVFGFKIPKVAEQIQSKVKNAIENMTGLTVKEVNIHILGMKVNETVENEKVSFDF